MLENAVQTDHHDIVFAERFPDAAHLGQAVADAAGTQHLERPNDHDASPKLIERKRLSGVQPPSRLKSGGHSEPVAHRRLTR
ncbi:hypothetical protein [Nitratireductor sp. GCM10026969]|uniref:hypothetical protein n=1 Tax=Nitratireductor sp. GCM10026969 TaxID=3252645 RepID=UPI00360C82B0